MPVLRNIGYLARCLPEGGQGEVHPVRGAALAWEHGRIAWAGAESDLPAAFDGWPSEDAGGRLVIPGLVDCHTHLAFGGWRGDTIGRQRLDQQLQVRRLVDIEDDRCLTETQPERFGALHERVRGRTGAHGDATQHVVVAAHANE